MSLDFLNRPIGSLDSPDFGSMEDVIWAPGADTENLISRIAQKLLSEVRHIRKEYERYQNDPNYNYSGRIHRDAILSRNNQIAKLQKELQAFKESRIVNAMPLMPDLELGKAWAAQHNFQPLPCGELWMWPDTLGVIFAPLKRQYKTQDEMYTALGKWIKQCWELLTVKGS